MMDKQTDRQRKWLLAIARSNDIRCTLKCFAARDADQDVVQNAYSTPAICLTLPQVSIYSYTYDSSSAFLSR